MSNQIPKMQLLDPIGVICKLILLQFYPSGTRLRIKDHIVELIKPDYTESLLWRRLNGDSRGDMCLLFTSIIRFIELYLMNNSQNETKSHDDCSNNFDIINSLKTLAKYAMTGIPCLEEVYGLSCAGLTLQYYINLLNEGIQTTYSKKLLPKYAEDVTNQNLIQPEKIKQIWKSDDIDRIKVLFDNCFSTKDKDNSIMLNGYITNIISILSAKDKEFKKIVDGAF